MRGCELLQLNGTVNIRRDRKITTEMTIHDMNLTQFLEPTIELRDDLPIE